MYPNTLLFIDGAWTSGQGKKTLDVANPATGSVLYMVEMPRDNANTYWANLHLAY